MARRLSPRKAGGRGGRVLRTGLAVVHRGEVVLPAAGDEAQAERVLEDAGSTIVYEFPVEIEVRAGDENIDVEEAIRRALDRLVAELENR